MKKTRLALLHSVIALLLCCSMLIGTTFAWFTDEVVSGNNIIRAGNLDIEMYWTDDLTTGTWYNAEKDGENTPFDYDLWEPGYTEVRYVKIVNAGSLALKYSLTLAPVGMVGKLAEVIDVFYAENVTANIADRTLGGMKHMGLLKDTIRGGEAAKGELLPKTETIVAIAMHMDEEAGNIYQGESIGDGFTFKLIATQMAKESDSFGSDYDEDAKFPGNAVIHFSSQESVADKLVNGALAEAVTVGSEANDIFADVPADVKLAAGADSLKLTVDTMTNSEANVELEQGEVKQSLDIHVDGVAADNTTPMLITLKGLMKKGLNSTSVAMYHVEKKIINQNGLSVETSDTVPMTLVANPTNHNEFSYDPATGDVIVAMQSFSEVVAVTNDLNPWLGNFNIDWYTANPDADSFVIDSAEELAGLGVIVDGGYNHKNENGDVAWVDLKEVHGIEADTFDKQIVKLGADIDLRGKDEGGNLISFNPIGCGYEDSSINSDGVTGRVFMGTFDGGIYENGEVVDTHTIRGLYQNGWELGLSYCNLGGGLFASVKDATIQNLTISGAEITMECVEMGVVAGLVQGSCTFASINIYDSKIANYQKATGGLIGEVSGTGTTTIENVVIGSDVVVGSLWGDFDAPVGGVIGARWDNENSDPQIEMKNVTVAARLDVYNDVTSAYQWYAYRRAGMLIGNTETAETINDRTVATAEFLTCENVMVVYGDWTKYHYCEFTNQTSDWQNGYPWVRVEAGENCSAFSNPRYGHPDVTSGEVKDTLHSHEGADEHLVELTFNQLYGGGQGVYGGGQGMGIGSHPIDGVTIGAYIITYVDNYKVIGTEVVGAQGDHVIQQSDPTPSDGSAFGGWVYEDGTAVNLVNKQYVVTNATNKNITLYPKWNGKYFIRFMNLKGELVYSEMFVAEQNKKFTNTAKANEILQAIQTEVDASGKVIEVYWEPDVTNLSLNVTEDIIVKAKVRLKNTSITLTPDNEDNPTYYMVTDVNASDTNIIIDIPAYVGLAPVMIVSEGAFDGFNNLHAIKIPNTVTTLEKDMFPGSIGLVSSDRQTLTIYYQGTKSQWDAMNKIDGVDEGSWFLDPDKDISWDNSLGVGSRIFFLDANGTVNVDQGYYEVTKISGTSPSDVVWTYYATITQDIKDACMANCNCEEICKNEKQRPDAIYWEGVEIKN